MSRPTKVLISVVGNPEGYREAVYHYGGHTMRSTFSSSVLLDAENPDRAVLVGQYTLAREGKDFGGLQEETIKYIMGCLDGADRFTDFVIAPGVFTSRAGGRETAFRGDIYNFYAYVLYRLADLFAGLRGDVEVVLDLTHGINYMGYMTMRAVSLVLDAYSTSYRAALKVVNSDPFPLGYSSRPSKCAARADANYGPPPDLGLNVVLEVDVVPSFNYPIGRGSHVLRPSAASSEEKARLGKELEERFAGARACLAKYRYFVAAVNTGSLLAAFSFADDFGRCADAAVELFASSVEVTGDKGSLAVVPKYSFTDSFESLVVAGLIREVVGIEGKAEVELDELDEKAEIYRGKAVYSVVKNEVDSLRKMIGEGVQKDRGAATSWTPLTRYADLAGVKYSPDPDSRTFFAHAGMPYALVEAMGTKLRYRGDRLERVKSLLIPPARGT